MKNLTTLFFLLFSLISFGQFQLTVDASVLDRSTKQHIPHVSIGIADKGIGTVSDAEGNFVLILNQDEVNENDRIEFSATGYNSRKIKLSVFLKYLFHSNKIFLDPEAIEPMVASNEVETFADRFERYNGQVIGSSPQGYQWKAETSLGSEIASLVKISSNNTKLDKLQFYINKNNLDSLLVRVNVYDYKRGYIGKNLLSSDVLHTISSEKGKQSIDLSEHNLVVNNDVLTSIELIETYGNDFLVEFSGINKDNGLAFTRYTPYDDWAPLPGLALGFNILTSVPKDELKAAKRVPPKSLTIYWDRSLSASDRNKEVELELLDTYLRQLNQLDVQVVSFGMDIYDKVDFSLSSFKQIDLLINYLRELPNDGAVSFKNILKNNENGSELAILFSDGNTIFEPLSQEISIPVFYVNSSSEADHNLLKNSALYGDGDYLNLSEMSMKDALKAMMAEVIDGTYYEEGPGGDMVKGQVLINDESYGGVTVRVKQTYKSTTTDENGMFALQARPGDVLEVSYFNVDSKEIVLDKKKDNLLINLKSNVQILEEVNIVAEPKERPKILTSMGLIEDDNSMSVIREEDLNKGAVFLADLIRGRLPGIYVYGPPGRERFLGRGRGFGAKLANVAFDVDGQVYLDPPNFIHPSMVKSIRLLSAFRATIPYGSFGSRGVIIIQTISGYYRANGFETVLAKDNDYEENLPLLKDKKINNNYIKDLNKNSTKNDALIAYTKFIQERTVRNTAFYVQFADLLIKYDKNKAIQVITNLAEIAEGNSNALKTLAYKLDDYGFYDRSIFVYEKLLEQNPDDIQSYRDLALAYKNNGEYSRSADIYRDILSGKYSNLDFKGLKVMIITEFKHLLLNHRHKFQYQDLPAGNRANAPFDA
ncbi:MAG: carboxypeptidase-like regulatory domain-containing protein [Bacteroidota bacterium]